MHSKKTIMNLADFDYHLPRELIAQKPLARRDDSRLLVLERGSGSIEHTVFSRLPQYVRPGDLLVANDTRVIPARLFGKKATGGWVELFLLDCRESSAAHSQVWECLIKSRRKTAPSMKLQFTEHLRAEVLEKTAADTWLVRVSFEGSFERAVEQAGRTPLPPYIKRHRTSPDDADRQRYQTVYARTSGAVAAPTAGLHFTEQLISEIRQKEAGFCCISLLVGYGTFQPIRDERVELHRMHSEAYSVSPETARQIAAARARGGRVIAVGTTSTRTLETLAGEGGRVTPGSGTTDLFVYPGFTFRAVDAMITNFHLPRSSLLLLVAAFANRELIMQAYREAVREKYRFFSYGDAMLIL